MDFTIAVLENHICTAATSTNLQCRLPLITLYLSHRKKVMSIIEALSYNIIIIIIIII